jgi:hypothetical protein
MRACLLAKNKLTTWISEGEKYAIVALSVKVEQIIASTALTSNFWVLADARLDLSTHWQEWLGSVSVRNIQECNLFLLSKIASSTPEILDAENDILMQRVRNFYDGLLLAGTFVPSYKPLLFTGSCRDGEIDIRQKQEFDGPIAHLFPQNPGVTVAEIQLAARLGENIHALRSTPPLANLYRLKRCLQVYTEARTKSDILDQLHQHCRCIDGLIASEPGQGTKRFKSRTELFIGPKHHDMMGKIYDVRSAVEHLHESRYLEVFDRNVRLELLKKEAVAELIARTALVRVLGDRNMWPHFANTAALAAFWTMPVADRRNIWGDPIDPLAALADFDSTHISDSQLGAN